jgi:hypothetical protein
MSGRSLRVRAQTPHLVQIIRTSEGARRPSPRKMLPMLRPSFAATLALLLFAVGCDKPQKKLRPIDDDGRRGRATAAVAGGGSDPLGAAGRGK